MENTIAIKKLQQIKEEGLFTRDLSFDEFIDGLCKRFAYIYGIILPRYNYEYIVDQLEKYNILD